MGQRDDGRKTRSRILDAACEVFGQKGYRDAKVAEICRRAGTNVAAVNYYFGDKASLYREAWEAAFQKEAAPEPRDGEDGSPEARLRSRIEVLISKFCGRGSSGRFTRMYLMELANPTGLIDEKWRKMIEPRRRHLLSIIREIAGPRASDETVLFCELSVIHQCRSFLVLRGSDLEYLLERPITPELMQRLVDHITRFSLAGIRCTAAEKAVPDYQTGA